MKRSAIISGIAFGAIAQLSLALNKNYNYVAVIEPHEWSKEKPAPYYDLSNVTTKYYNDLGWEIANVRSGVGGDYQSVIEYTEYYPGGLVSHKWQPVGSYGDFINEDDIYNLANEFYNDNRACTKYQYTYDNQPVLASELRPGEAQEGKVLRHKHDIVSYREVPMFDVDSNGKLYNTGDYYQDGSLRMKVSCDEENRSVTTHTDYDGNIVRMSRWDSQTKTSAITYFVRDICGRLRFVIPPEAYIRLTTKGVCDADIVAKYCTEYVYDNQNRLIERRLPGCDPEYFVYDSFGRVVFRQDATLREKRKWQFYAVDHKNRPAIEGYMMLDISPESLRNLWKEKVLRAKFDAKVDYDTSLGYTIDNLPSSSVTRSKAWYYDSYSFWTAHWEMPANPSFDLSLSESQMGRLTGTAVMDMGFPIFSIFLINPHGQEIARCEQKFNGEYCRSTFCKINKFGQPLRKLEILDFPKGEWNATDDRVEIETAYNYYVPGGEIASVSRKIDGQQMPTTSYLRDAIGRLTAINTHGGAGTTAIRHTENRSYDVQNRLTAIQSPAFRETVGYSVSGMVANRQSAYTVGNATQEIGMTYAYDSMGRLQVATQPEATNNFPADFFTEQFAYDLNGNIIYLTRGLVDGSHIQQLSIRYDGNKITGIVDESDDMLTEDVPRIASGNYQLPFNYLSDGAIGSDATRGITGISYNDLRQVESVRFDNGNQWTLLHDASGQKRSSAETVRYVTSSPSDMENTAMEKAIKTKVTRHAYYGNIVRENLKIHRIEGEEGFYLKDMGTGNWQYYRYQRNHQGSIAMVVDNASGNVAQHALYYASGLPVAYDSNAAAAVNNRFHVGKEFSQFNGLNWYDNEARQYDPVIGRFTSPDPMAEKYPALSPFAYCANNPLLFTDPSGMVIVIDPNISDFQKNQLAFYHSQGLNSPYFAQAYNALDESEEIYTITYGDTATDSNGNSVQGQYSSKTRTITFRNDNNLRANVYTEELIHAYQDLKGLLSDQTSYNVEYEAKIVTAIITGDVGFPDTLSGAYKQEAILYNLLINSSSDKNCLPTLKEFNSAGKQFIEHYQQIEKPGSAYLTPIGMPSPVLIDLLLIK